MKHQKVGVDGWEMLKTSMIYIVLAIAGWFVVRMFATAFRIPGRMRQQREMLENSIEMLKRQYPDLEEEMKKLEEEMKNPTKENADKTEDSEETKTIEDKKVD